MDPKHQVLPFVQTAVTCAIDSADAYQRRVTELGDLAKAVAEARLAANDPSGMPVVPLTVAAKIAATAFAALAKASATGALAPFL